MFQFVHSIARNHETHGKAVWCIGSASHNRGFLPIVTS